ncbi:hypothetical protein HanRHA438_Chr03g0126321 [Helianthus annuus]|nr:hypothetical protein HanIR_Chr03g0125101 [Helianthus annuus]KAJ0936040.1 hypothetical protein HanRHA438_Chr03g0126321 [Helianthus annuus]
MFMFASLHVPPKRNQSCATLIHIPCALIIIILIIAAQSSPMILFLLSAQ